MHHKILWLGPSSQKDVQAEFDAIFGRSVVLAGEAYVVAPAETVQQVYRGMMAKKHHYPTGNFSIHGKGMLRSILGPGHLARLDAYQDECQRRPGSGDNPESFICDVDHWPRTPGDTSGAFFPCQLTHGHLYAHRKRRLIVGMEHLCAQGWHVFPQEDDLFATPLLPKLRTLSENALKKLSGNGMHLPCLAAWWLYVMSRIARVHSPNFVGEHSLANAEAESEHEDESDKNDESEKEDVADLNSEQGQEGNKEEKDQL